MQKRGIDWFTSTFPIGKKENLPEMAMQGQWMFKGYSEDYCEEASDCKLKQMMLKIDLDYRGNLYDVYKLYMTSEGDTCTEDEKGTLFSGRTFWRRKFYY